MGHVSLFSQIRLVTLFLIFLLSIFSTASWSQTSLQNASDDIFVEQKKVNISSIVDTKDRSFTILSIKPGKLKNAQLINLSSMGLPNYYFERLNSKSLGLGRSVISFTILRYDSADDSLVSQGEAKIYLSANKVSGVWRLDGKSYQIIPKKRYHVLKVIDIESFPLSNHGKVDETSVADAFRDESASSSSTFNLASDVPEENIVDVLVVYDITAYSENDDPTTFAQMAIDQGNTVLANSQVNAALRLAGTANVDYMKTNSEADLDAISYNQGGVMEEVQNYRDVLGADLVVLMVAGSYDNCGIAWLLSGVSRGFSVVNSDCSVGNYTFIHEIGHNYGAHHNPEEDTNFVYPYGQGMYNQDAVWRTVMSYRCPDKNCPRIPYFSNPDLSYEGSPLGTNSTHDNARVLNNRAATVAQFLSAPTSSCTTYSTSIAEHLNAGRVYSERSWFVSYYYVVGSDEYLGRDSSVVVNLVSTSSGFTTGSCANQNDASIYNFNWEVSADVMTVTGSVASGQSTIANALLFEASSADHPNLCRWLTSSAFECRLVGMVPGNYQFTLDTLSEDGARSANPETFSVIIDGGSAPEILSADLSVSGDTVTVTGRVIDVDEDLDRVLFSVNGQFKYCSISADEFTCINSSLESGNYAGELVAYDSNENQSATYGPLNFVIDIGSAPRVTDFVLTPSDNSVTMSGTIYDEDGDVVSVYMELHGPTTDSRDCALSGSGQYRTFSCTFTGLAPGTYLFGTLITDSKGNNGFYEGNNLFTLGASAPPTVTITDAIINGLQVTLSGTVSDPNGSNTISDIYGTVVETGETFLCFYAGSFQCQWEALTLGNYTLRVTAVDVEGNSGDDSTSVTLSGGCVTYTDTLEAHANAGRAELVYRYFANRYYAVGSGDYLGRNADATATLAETQPGYFIEGSCP